MAMKQYRRYRMDFSGYLLHIYCILCGLSLFLRVAYYFMLVNPKLCGTTEVLLSMILPLLLCGAAMVVLKYFKFNAPGVMGIIGALMCICLMIGTFFSGNTLRIVLAIVLYVGSAALLIGTVGGYVPTRQFSVILFCIILALRIFVFRPAFSVLGWVLELSDLAMLVSLLILPLTMVIPKKKNA